MQTLDGNRFVALRALGHQGLVAYPLEILGAEQQMRAEANLAAGLGTL
jgi:hypothetical protein